MFGLSKLGLHKRNAMNSLHANRLAYLVGAVNVVDVSEGSTNVFQNRIGTNSAQFTMGDILTLTSGFLAVAGANSRPVGISNYSGTMTADNQTVAKFEPAFYPASDNLRFEMDFSANAAEADVGSFFQLTGATGAQKVDYATKSATVGPVVLEKLDPRGEGSVLRGLFAFAKGFQSYTVA